MRPRSWSARAICSAQDSHAPASCVSWKYPQPEPAPEASLAEHAALTDQSDAWLVVRLEGAGARDVLARLTPVDLRDSAFKRGHTARTELAHMMASLTRVGPQAYQVLVFRGFSQTLAHDLKSAMEGVAARRPG